MTRKRAGCSTVLSSPPICADFRVIGSLFFMRTRLSASITMTRSDWPFGLSSIWKTITSTSTERYTIAAEITMSRAKITGRAVGCCRVTRFWCSFAPSGDGSQNIAEGSRLNLLEWRPVSDRTRSDPPRDPWHPASGPDNVRKNISSLDSNLQGPSPFAPVDYSRRSDPPEVGSKSGCRQSLEVFR